MQQVEHEFFLLNNENYDSIWAFVGMPSVAISYHE